MFTDLAGNRDAGLSGSTAWNFGTAATDTTPPTLLSLSPADDGSNVAAGANLVLRFDEAVVAGSGNITIRSGARRCAALPSATPARCRSPAAS